MQQIMVDRLIVGESKIVTIDRSQPFSTKFIGSRGWTIWRGSSDNNGHKGKEDQDICSLAITKLDLSKVLFKTMLKLNSEKCINGEERQRRLRQAGHIRLDAMIFWTLWNNKLLIPKKWKEKINGNTRYIFFDGTVLRNPSGFRNILYLYWDHGQWNWHCFWLGSDFNANYPSAVLASSVRNEISNEVSIQELCA